MVALSSHSPAQKFHLLFYTLFFAFFFALQAKEEKIFYCTISLNGTEFHHIELALTPAEWERGLMNRDTLLPDGGMLFCFPESGEHSFWMRNTRIPLDLLYLSAEGTILSLHRMKVERPRNLYISESAYLDSLSLYQGKGQFALELPGGSIQRLGLQVGQKIPLALADWKKKRTEIMENKS